MKNKQEKKTCNDKGEWGNFIYNGNSFFSFKGQYDLSKQKAIF